jgi:hypothetical protein
LIHEEIDAMTDPRDRFETLDGSTPTAVPLEASVGEALPLSAFAILESGDAFEDVSGLPPRDGKSRANTYVRSMITVVPHGAQRQVAESVLSHVVDQISGNLQLVARLERARPIVVELIPPKHPLSRYGFPAVASNSVSGLFWDDPSWDNARIALRAEHLNLDPVLVVHEMAHAIHHLAFTSEERALLYRLLLPAFGSKAAVDEVFAIYSEREFLPAFSEKEKRAPGVYGAARRRWDENHLLTRFVRNLYFPYKPLAGPRLPGGGLLGGF